MLASVRPYATAGISLVGASVIAIAPITAPPADISIANPEAPTVTADVNLAANSVLNVPQNLWNSIVSSTAWHIEGVQMLADAMASSGNWNVDSGNPNNVWGWDPANPAMLAGIVRMIAPYRPFSDELAYQMNAWAMANLPMNSGCPAFSCPDPQALLGVMFKVPIWEFWRPEGVTFGVDDHTPEFNPVGGAPVPWYGTTAQFSPSDPISNFLKYLLRDPDEQPEEFQVKRASTWDLVTAYANLARALQITGHLASWVAVDEIETFVKLFLPKPATGLVPALAPDNETEASAMPQLDLARTVALDVPATEQTGEQTGVQTEGATNNRAEIHGLTVTATDDLSDAGTEPEIEKSQPVESEPATPEVTDVSDTEDEAGTTAAPEPEAPASTGKHAKRNFDPSEVVKSLHDRFSAANRKSSDGAEQAGAGQKADAESGSTAKNGSDGSDAGAKGADD